MDARAEWSDHPQPGTVEVLWRSEHDPDAVLLAVTVPTFQRPEHLKRTLESVLTQAAPLPFAIVVMDNHPDLAGAKAAQELLATNDVAAVIVAAHERGNCSAYNAGWWTALETFPALDFVLVIDDDEIARPGWIAEMIRVAEETGADCTGAPQWPVFPEGTGQVAACHPVFRPPYRSTGPVPILYSSGNVLIRAALLRRHGFPYLDTRFNFIGGGDSDFYARVERMGARFAWAADAGQDETIPARRAEFSWLNARALRNGTISALIERKAARTSLDVARRLSKTAVLLALSPWRGVRDAVVSRSATQGLNHMLVALGRLLAEFGFANEQYRAANRN